MTFSSRPYANAIDLQAMLDLLYTARPITRLNDYPSEIAGRLRAGREGKVGGWG